MLDCNSRSEADRGAHIVVQTAGTEHRDTLTSLSRACSDHRAVELDYASLAAQKRRKIRVHPYGLLNHRGIWYVLGTSMNDKDGRIFIFRAERILGATVLDETFTVPADFNLRDYMGEHMVEIEVFSKYDLTEKAVQGLKSVLERVPHYVPALEKLLQIDHFHRV